MNDKGNVGDKDKTILWYQGIERIINLLIKANKIFLSIAALSLFLMMTIDTINIIGVKLRLFTIPSGKEFIEEMMTIVVYTGIGYVLFKGGHIKTEVFIKKLRQNLISVFNSLGYLLMFFIGIYIFWTTSMVSISFWEKNVVQPSIIPVPMAPFVTLIALSFLNFSLCNMILFVKEIFIFQMMKRKGGEL